jgi:hypothetical protein
MPNNRLRKLLCERTQLLGRTEHEEIFKILRRHGIPYSYNSVVVLIDLSSVDDAIIDEIRAAVDYCFENKQELDEYDKRLHACKLSNNFDSLVGGPPAGGHEASPQTPDSQQTLVLNVSTAAPDAADAAAVVAAAVPVVSSRERQIALERQLAASVVPPRGKAVTNRFQLAKKKYARRRVCDRRQAGDTFTSQLQPDAYLL